jgi:hypothetical protein
MQWADQLYADFARKLSGSDSGAVPTDSPSAASTPMAG